MKLLIQQIKKKFVFYLKKNKKEHFNKILNINIKV